jgi:predicted nucleic acid-binding protein
VIVLDASTAVELVLRTPAAGTIESRLLAEGETLHAPHLLDIEVAHVVRRYFLMGQLSAERGRAALSDLAALPVARYPHDLLLPRIWELRQNVTAYDAAYVALAEALPAPLLTRDSRLATSVGHAATIELV